MSLTSSLHFSRPEKLWGKNNHFVVCETYTATATANRQTGIQKKWPLKLLKLKQLFMVWLNPFVNWPIWPLSIRQQSRGLQNQPLNESENGMSLFFRLAGSVLTVRSIPRDSKFLVSYPWWLFFFFFNSSVTLEVKNRKFDRGNCLRRFRQTAVDSVGESLTGIGTCAHV